MEAHLPYEPPEPYLSEELPAGVDPATARAVEQDQWAHLTGATDLGEREFEILRALYRAEIRRLDDRLGRLFDAVEATERETALIVVADHGENVGEHGLMDHQYSLHGTLLDVPLAVRYPPAFEPGRTDALVETRSLYATVLDLAGVDPPDGVAPSLADGDGDGGGGRGREHAIAEYTAPQPSLDDLAAEYGPLGPSVRRLDRALRSIRTDRWRLIEGSDGSRRLYDLRADPDETAPVDRPAVERRLCDRLAAERGPMTGPPGGGRSEGEGEAEAEVAGASHERLRDLGYL
jgi:arylsulfatase A-like enzyme